jgi:riboflavin synthase
MFTGLVEAIGLIDRVEPDGAGGCLLVVREPELAPQLAPGESVAVNGACLTVVARDADAFHFQAGPETLRLTNLGGLVRGDTVNLERALRVGDRLGGHLVQGHVDGLGTLRERGRDDGWQVVTFGCPPELAAQMVPKGSVAVDGVSLTVIDVGPDFFTVMLIPHTLTHTTLGTRPVGAAVNLETDVLGKYAWKALQAYRTPTDGTRPEHGP